EDDPCIDNDGDGYGFYCTLGDDCDDGNILVFQWQQVYRDLDGDGFTAGALLDVCSGACLPAGFSTTSNGSDCNDLVGGTHTPTSAYRDGDNDAYTIGPLLDFCGTGVVPAGFSAEASSSYDCNDADG